MSRALLGLLLLVTSPAAASDDALWHHRNLGKAFYENPATQYEAVGEFEKALALAPNSARERVNYGLALLRAGRTAEGIAELEKAQRQDPAIPHTWFNLGIALKRESRHGEAITQLEGMIARVPGEAIAHYNLGVLYKLSGDAARSLQHFERAAKLDPSLAGPHFQLATAYRQAKRSADAEREMALFREIKQRQQGAAVPEDLEWSYYSEIYETIEPIDGEGPAPAKLDFAPRRLRAGLQGASLFLIDARGDGGTDLLVVSAGGIKLRRRGGEVVTSGLETLRGVMAVAPGDFDNDGLVDLVVLGRDATALYRNMGGTFRLHPSPLPAPYRRAVWLDYDHDYDLDLVLLGDRAALWRNEGAAGFAERPGDVPFAPGKALDAVVFDLVADTQGMDLAVLYADRPAVLYRDRLGGRYEAQPLTEVKPTEVPANTAEVQPSEVPATSSEVPATSSGASSGASQILAHDIDHDGWTDLVVAGNTTAAVLRNDQKGGFRVVRAPAGLAPPWLVADLDNRGQSTLLAAGGLFALRDGELIQHAAPATWPAAVQAAGAADFDGDGRVDLAVVDGSGALLHLTNRTVSQHRWLGVRLAGVKNLKLAPGAEVEVKAGRRYQKQLYQGVPLHFGLGPRATVDTVRITWPNGLIQNEARQETGRLALYEEAQRLSGSCPMIYTWNGREFEFITDVLGVAPLGASAGDGTYFPVDHDEYVQIPGSSLAEEAGTYEIRIVEELREVAYLDTVRLLAVDHPESVAIYTSDKFKGPPFPEFRLYGVERPLRPVAARDHHGRDVRERLLSRDRTYPDGFQRDLAGVAELHSLELDFGAVAAADEAVLVLHGWVDWADGSTFLQIAQGGGGLVMPYLQVQDAGGQWQTVIEDMGMPAGKPKTIVVDLSGKFLSEARRVRIVTSLAVYWDEIFLSEATAEPDAALHEVPATSAALRFGGFSRVVIHPERLQPEHFVYAERRSQSMWNPTPGRYTRYGDVHTLLGEIDDRLVVMGSGDELVLRFDAGALPPLPPGQRRDFLLFVDGWAKDGDANTAYSQTVEPLPYHAMPQYPYTAPHRFPDDGIHQLFREHYLIRPALRLLRPLAPELRPPVVPGEAR